MTQRIFKKSNKQDMIDLFNIMPDWVETVDCMDSDTISLRGNIKWYTRTYELDNDLFDIDFETDKVEEMIIERPNEE